MISQTVIDDDNKNDNNQFEKYKNLGLTGLANVGNTCYLNSCMQVLSHTYELNHLLDSGEYKKRLNKKSDSVLLLEWDNLRQMMWSRNCTIAPIGFVKAVQKISSIKGCVLFSGHLQNDVQEFLLFMIDCFHNSLAREVTMNITGNVENEKDKLATACFEMMNTMYKKEYSEMIKLFYGIHVSEITSIEDNRQLSFRPEPFSVMSLSIPEKDGQVSIYDCFDLYCKKEVLEGDNAWYNETTKQKENVKRGIVFWSLPDILIIDLKRWGNNGRKLNKIIDVPIENADFTKYVKGYCASSYMYDLYGICNHSGNSMGGHYTAYIKNANNKWYDCNDTIIKEISKEKLISEKSYCFFYRKKNNNL
jgi:ubiquitin carboxyl-terminal hydrolase 8